MNFPLLSEKERERRINQRVREIRYGEGCGVEKALRWATEEMEDWERTHAPTAQTADMRGSVANSIPNRRD